MRSEVNGTSACRSYSRDAAGGALELVLGDQERGFGRVALDPPLAVDLGELGVVGQGPADEDAPRLEQQGVLGRAAQIGPRPPDGSRSR